MKSLVGGQKNYPASKRELLAIMFALKRWRPILVGRRFWVEMDHQALVYLHSSTKYMVLDWLNFILEFDFYVVHKKGIDHVLPDVLSRIVEKKQK